MARQISAVRKSGWRVIVVSSGAVAAGFALVGDNVMPTASGCGKLWRQLGKPKLFSAGSVLYKVNRCWRRRCS